LKKVYFFFVSWDARLLADEFRRSPEDFFEFEHHAHFQKHLRNDPIHTSADYTTPHNSIQSHTALKEGRELGTVAQPKMCSQDASTRVSDVPCASSLAVKSVCFVRPKSLAKFSACVKDGRLRASNKEKGVGEGVDHGCAERACARFKPPSDHVLPEAIVVDESLVFFGHAGQPYDFFDFEEHEHRHMHVQVQHLEKRGSLPFQCRWPSWNCLAVGLRARAPSFCVIGRKEFLHGGFRLHFLGIRSRKIMVGSKECAPGRKGAGASEWNDERSLHSHSHE
jgi:hypothetical protein